MCLHSWKKSAKMLEKYKAEAERLRSAAQSERDKAENLRGKSEDEADRHPGRGPPEGRPYPEGWRA